MTIILILSLLYPIYTIYNERKIKNIELEIFKYDLKNKVLNLVCHE